MKVALSGRRASSRSSPLSICPTQKSSTQPMIDPRSGGHYSRHLVTEVWWRHQYTPVVVYYYWLERMDRDLMKKELSVYIQRDKDREDTRCEKEAKWTFPLQQGCSLQCSHLPWHMRRPPSVPHHLDSLFSFLDTRYIIQKRDHDTSTFPLTSSGSLQCICRGLRGATLELFEAKLFFTAVISLIIEKVQTKMDIGSCF